MPHKSARNECVVTLGRFPIHDPPDHVTLLTAEFTHVAEDHVWEAAGAECASNRQCLDVAVWANTHSGHDKINIAPRELFLSCPHLSATILIIIF